MTERVGILGWPVAHSLSPTMHNAAFAALGMDWRYELFPVPSERFAEEVARLLAEGVRGFNVTIPHKRAALTLPQVREVSEAARAIGAANTLTRLSDQTDALRAENTDWLGFLDDLRAHGVEPQGMACVVLGTGGSARAVGYALRYAGAAAITYISRDPDRAGDLAPVQSSAALRALAPRADLIVNCTPLGMWPRVEGSPWPPDVLFPSRAVLYDLVYTPTVTRMMQQAQVAGARAVGGLGMLARQGALAFAHWTGRTPPLDVMTRALQAFLEGK